MQLTILVMPGRFAVCKVPAESYAKAPSWSECTLAILREPDFWTIVCGVDEAPALASVELDWKALRLVGKFPFNLTGVLASVLVPLATAQVGIFALSTYDTDIILVKEVDLHKALEALTGAGHVVLSSALEGI